MAERSWVGLVVHAQGGRGRLESGSGELRSLRAPAVPAETVAWLGQFQAPVRVADEAGPTGYRLARACAAAGSSSTVAAPSKIPRASGDTVKTDRRDAERAPPTAASGEPRAVPVPEPHEEVACDLVRAREDARRVDAGTASALDVAVAAWAGLQRERLDTRARGLAAAAAFPASAAPARLRRVLRCHPPGEGPAATRSMGRSPSLVGQRVHDRAVGGAVISHHALDPHPWAANQASARPRRPTALCARSSASTST